MNYCSTGYIYYDADDIFSTTPNYSFTIRTYHPEVGMSYGYLAGTSMAAPQVAGTAALILSLNKTLTPAQVRTILQQTADDKGPAGFDNQYGWGRINAYRAVKKVVEGYGATITNAIIPPGELLQFASGIKLRVTGRLVAVGTSNNRITFTRSGGQWYGIEFYYNYGSGSEIQYANIQNAQYGVSSYGTDTYLTRNHFTYNSTGVYVNGSINSMNWCGFEYNTYGIRCDNYGDANIQTNNVIRYNSWGVSGDYTSAPAVGSYIGYNSLYSNNYYDVYSDYWGTISARGNWWGQYPAYPSVTMNVDFSGELSTDPNGGFRASPEKLAASRSLEKSPPIADSAGMKELDEAYKMYHDGDYENALAAFESLIDRYSDSFSGARALAFADRIRQELGRDAKAALQETMTTSGETRTGALARSLLTGHLIRESSYDQAMNLALELVSNADPLIAKTALFNAGNVAWYGLDDKARGTQYFEKLIAQFPGEPESQSAQVNMGTWEPQVVEKGTEQETEPETTELSLETYPNPFNPTTAIRFSIPQDGLVTLRIYDVLGRVVATLVNEERAAGPYRVQWDASHVPSGVYFSRLETRSGAVASKLLLVR